MCLYREHLLVEKVLFLYISAYQKPVEYSNVNSFLLSKIKSTWKAGYYSGESIPFLNRKLETCSVIIQFPNSYSAITVLYLLDLWLL